MSSLKTYVVFGTSMNPTIRAGDIVYIDAEFPFLRVQVGDIVLFLNPNDPTGSTTHRVMEQHPDWLWTKGDNNVRMDPLRVTLSNYRGRLSEIVRATPTTMLPVLDWGTT